MTRGPYCLCVLCVLCTEYTAPRPHCYSKYGLRAHAVLYCILSVAEHIHTVTLSKCTPPVLSAKVPYCVWCGSTHRAPWGVAPATPRTNLCVISSSCLQALASIDLWLWSVSSAEWWLEPLLDTPSASPLGRGSSHAPNLPAVIVAAALGVHESECVCCWLVWSEYSTLTKKIQRLIRRPASTAPRL